MTFIEIFQLSLCTDIDNGLIGAPEIQCNPDTIEMAFRTKRMFTGLLTTFNNYIYCCFLGNLIKSENIFTFSKIFETSAQLYPSIELICLIVYKARNGSSIYEEMSIFVTNVQNKRQFPRNA